MINIYTKTNLFDPDDILISWNFEGEKKIRNEYKIRFDQLEIAKHKLRRKALAIYVTELFTGRKNNFQFWQGEVIQSKIEAMEKLDRDVPFLKEYTDISALARRIQVRIIPQLEILRPGKKSKIVHYGERLDKLSAYVNSILTISTLHDSQNTITPTNYA